MWDLFDADGRFLGSVALPHAFNPKHVTERTVTGVLKDDSRYRAQNGVPICVRSLPHSATQRVER